MLSCHKFISPQNIIILFVLSDDFLHVRFEVAKLQMWNYSSYIYEEKKSSVRAEVVKTIGVRNFLHLLDKHLNWDNPLRNNFNRITVKIIYSCTKNSDKILNNHNRRLQDEVIKNGGRLDVASCNSRSKGECPLGGRGNSRNAVYQACISPIEHNNDGERVYVGTTTGNWKKRLYNHWHSFSKLLYLNIFGTLQIRGWPLK